MADQQYGPPQYGQPGQYAPSQPYPYGQPGQYGQFGYPAPPKKRRRVFLWFFLALQVLFLIWIIAGANSGNGAPTDCGTLDAVTCNDAQTAGTAIGVGLLIALWVAVDFIAGITYGIYRLATRR
jgi:hypothetical protein